MGKSKAGDLFLASTVHVMRDGKDAKGDPIKETVVIPGNRMVSETDLTDKEIESLKPHKVLRAPTFEEIQAAEARPDAEASAKAAAEAEADRIKLLEDQKFEADQLKAEQDKKAAEEKAKLEADQAAEREKAAAAAAKSAGSGKAKK
jgi:hypothetical protein